MLYGDGGSVENVSSTRSMPSFASMLNRVVGCTDSHDFARR